MLQEAQKAHDKAIAKPYKQLRNLLSGDAQYQWDHVCRKMHERDLRAAVSSQVKKKVGVCKQGRPSWTVLSYITSQSSVLMQPKGSGSTFSKRCASPRGPLVQQHISRMGVLNDYVKYLPTLKDSSKAVPTTKKGNIPFGEADLATIVLLSVPMSWQNQYNLNHSMVPKSTCTLLPDLEAIKRVMVEK